jgi:hypothetical protein
MQIILGPIGGRAHSWWWKDQTPRATATTAKPASTNTSSNAVVVWPNTITPTTLPSRIASADGGKKTWRIAVNTSDFPIA